VFIILSIKNDMSSREPGGKTARKNEKWRVLFDEQSQVQANGSKYAPGSACVEDNYA
jgi:hypothetical protein